VAEKLLADHNNHEHAAARHETNGYPALPISGLVDRSLQRPIPNSGNLRDDSVNEATTT
jgi:hypothetical protein